MSSNLTSLQRLHSRASLGGVYVPVQSNMFDSEHVQSDLRKFPMCKLGEQGNKEMSSHVNLGDITYYNMQQQKRQRPQTGKIRTTQASIADNMAMKPLNGQTSAKQPFQVISSQTQQQQNAGNQTQHRRMASAKQDTRFRSRQAVEHQLQNTREYKQSSGFLTTAAGTNYNYNDVQSRKVKQYHHLPPTQPIIRQHFMPNPASKRLQSAKATVKKQSSTALIINSQGISTSMVQSKAAPARPKSGVPQGQQLRPRSGHHRRLYSGKVMSDRQKFISSGGGDYQTGTQQLSSSNANAMSTQPIVFSQDIFLDNQGKEIDQTSLTAVVNTVDPSMINLAIKQLGGKPHHQPTRNQKNVQHKTTASGRLHSGKSNKRVQSRQMLNQTIYRLPSLSQCIENKILPRSSEYMRRLYSIALRNHENQVPQIVPQRAALMEEPPTPTDTRLGNDTMLRGDTATGPGATGNQAENQDTAQEQTQGPSALRKSPQDQITTQQIEKYLPRTNNSVVNKPKEAGKLKHARSQSFATLKVKNLQFPYDQIERRAFNLVRHEKYHPGSFSHTKLRDLNLGVPTGRLSPNHDLDPAVVGLSAKKKRPQTAGRMGAVQPASDLFNNQFISQQVLGVKHNQSTDRANENENGPGDEQPDDKKLNLYQIGNSPTAIGDLKMNGSPRAHFVANLRLDQDQAPGKATQIVMCVKPQSTDSIENLQDDAQDNISTAFKNPGTAGILNLDHAINSPESKSPNKLYHAGMNYGGATSERHSEERSKSAASRRMSARESRKDPATLSTFFRKSSKNLVGVNSLSPRDFPMHFQEKNGGQVVVQMSGQAIYTKRLTSARQNSNTNNDSKSQGSRGSISGRKKLKKSHVNAKMSSTHSLQINMTQKNKGNSSDNGSHANTNRLEGEESDVNIDEVGASRVMDNSKAQSKKKKSGSRASSYENQDLRHLDEDQVQNKPVRQIYPLTNASDRKFAHQYADESPHISLQSQTHSHNLVDTQMRLKQVYIDENTTKEMHDQQQPTKPQIHGTKIHRIPQPHGSNNPTLSPKARQIQTQDANQQLLVCTDDPQQVAKLMQLQSQQKNPSKGRDSQMSNPLNNLKTFDYPWKTTQIKSINFDSNGEQIINEPERGYSGLEQTMHSEMRTLSPDRIANSKKYKDLQLSPSQRVDSQRSAQGYYTSNVMEQKYNTQANEADSKAKDNFHQHKQFKNHLQVKRQTTKPPTDSRNVPSKSATQPQATLKGRKVRLQSAQLRHAKPANKGRRRSRQNSVSLAQQNDLFIDLMKQQAMMGMAVNNYNDGSDHNQGGLNLLENSKATVHNVPPLALPQSDTATELLQVSHLPSSHRNLAQLSYSQSSFTKLNNLQQQESQKILNSFHKNNVRTNLKGTTAMNNLITGIDLIDMINNTESTGQMKQISLSCSPLRRPGGQKQNLSMKHLTMANMADSKRSLEKMMIGAQGEEQDNYASSNRDFAATLAKERSQGSRSSSEEKIQTINSMNPKLDDELLRMPIPVNTSPSPLLISENNHGQPVNTNDEEVIQEIEEGSSNASRSKISVSVQSIRKQKTESRQNSGDENGIIHVKELPIEVHKSMGQNVSNSMTHIHPKTKMQAPVGVIRSVYEMEAQALRSGIIKAYSGKGDKRRGDIVTNKDNTDLQHFLNTRNQERSSAMRCSTRRLDSQHSSVRNSRTTKMTKPKSQESIGSAGKRTQDRGSKISLNTASAVGFMFMPIARQKVIEERPRTATPEERILQPSMEIHQKRAHQVLLEAQKIMNDAKRLKLDADVVNQHIFELFSDKQETKHLAAMIDQVTQDLGTQTLSTGQRRGLEIPFQISNPPSRDQVNSSKLIISREQDVSSILTRKLSNSSANRMNNLDSPKEAITKLKTSGLPAPPSFAPGSPHSIISTVRQGELAQSKPGFNFAINSAGGSTNRFSKQELPFFGGIASGRHAGNINDSVKTGKINDSEELRSGASYHANVNSKGQVMPVIDYSQNFLMPQPMTQVQIRSGQAEIANQMTNMDYSKGGLQMSKKGAKRPHSSGRYAKSSHARNASNAMNLVQIQSGAIQIAELQNSNNPAKGQSHSRKSKEHPDQPMWATRQNLKSKFNLMTAVQQQRQAQKFFIDCKDERQANVSSKNGTMLNTTAHFSPSDPRRATLSYANTSAQHGTPSQHMLSPQMMQKNNTASLVPDTKIEEEINSRCDSPLMKKILSMPVDGRGNQISVETGQQSMDRTPAESKPLELEEDSEQKVDERGDSASSRQGEGNTMSKLQENVYANLETYDNPVDQYSDHGMGLQRQNQSMQVDMTKEAAEDEDRSSHLEMVVDTNRILERHVLESQEMINSASAHFISDAASQPGYEGTHSSRRSLVNSRKVIEKAVKQGYVGRSRAGDSHFSLTQNLINSQQSLNKLHK